MRTRPSLMPLKNMEEIGERFRPNFHIEAASCSKTGIIT